MSRFGMTGKIVAKADRSQDPFVYIDHLRQEVYEIGEWRDGVVEKRLKALEDAERDRLTETGVLRTVRDEFSKREINWMKWAARSVLAGLGTAALGAAAWVLKLAWRGLTT